MSTHLFHLVSPSPWPFITAIGIFFFVSGLGFFMHRITFGIIILLFGIIILLSCALLWFKDIIYEATGYGYHTKVVRYGIQKGFLLFLVSEIMLFFGFFWAFFHSSLCPSVDIGGHWPSFGLDVISTRHYPLLNTMLLIISGFSVTWVHRSLALSNFKGAIDGFLVTIILGVTFIFLQIIEYYEANYVIMDGIYSSCFYMLTGLHGTHVIVGIIFLIVCFFRLLNNHFLMNHYGGLVYAIWYWHFVDIVWIILFVMVYCWGNW